MEKRELCKDHYCHSPEMTKRQENAALFPPVNNTPDCKTFMSHSRGFIISFSALHTSAGSGVFAFFGGWP